jgi:hypothetical protein
MEVAAAALKNGLPGWVWEAGAEAEVRSGRQAMKQETVSREAEETLGLATEYSPEGERLDAARAEFRQAWHARVEQRERRLSQARRRVAWGRAASSLCGSGVACCALGLLCVRSLFAYLLAGVGAAGVLLLLALGATIYFEHRVLNLEEDDLQPR